METDTFFALLGKDATLTGRTEIWSGIMQQMSEHPWRGFGYGAVWDDPSFTGPKAWIGYQAHFIPADAHSGWLELYIALGLGGVILFALFLLQIWAQSFWAAYTSPAGWLVLPMMTSYTITMMTESIAMNWHELHWVVVVAEPNRAKTAIAQVACYGMNGASALYQTLWPSQLTFAYRIAVGGRRIVGQGRRIVVQRIDIGVEGLAIGRQFTLESRIDRRTAVMPRPRLIDT